MTSAVRSTVFAYLCALAVLVVALQAGGGAPQSVPAGLPDPGAFTGWGLPAVKLITDFAAVGTIGFLAAAVFLLPSSGDTAQGLAVDAIQVARRAAAVWSLSSIALYFLTVSDVFALPVNQVMKVSLLSEFATTASLGRGILGQIAIAALIFLGARWLVGIRPLAALLGLSLAGLIPISLTGHSAGAGSHDLAIISILVHLVGVTLWVGGLAALAWVARRGSKRLDAAIARYSVLAAWCFGTVAVSGVLNASVRIGSLSSLVTTSYGVLVLGKVAALVGLGFFGLAQRRRIVANGSGFRSLAWRELLLMVMAMGLAIALSRTPTPVPDNLYRTPIEELIGGSMPPAPTVLRFVFGWSPNGVGLAIVGLGTALYLKGVQVMRTRGDHWPLGRTIAWLIGMVIVGWATFGGLGLYSHVLFSAHMVSHMMLSMVAPIFLVLAAPVTLALRTLPGPRQPGEISPRQLLNGFLHSRFSRFVTHPLIGPALFIASLYGLYFSPIFGALMQNHLGHAAMVVHFLAVGTLYYYVLIGIDPSPRKLDPLVRFGALMVTVPFHAFFSISVMSSNSVFAKSYWIELDRPYLTNLLTDQYLGGSIAWAMGEVPLVLVMGAILVQWIRSDRREARRFDRSERRTGDAELSAYNDYLASLNEHGQRRDTHEQ